MEIKDMTTPSITLISGKSRQGKSHLMEYIIKCLCVNKKFSFGLVFAGTKFTGSYKFFPDKCCLDDLQDDDINAWMRMLADSKIRGDARPSFIIIDDMIGKVNWYSQSLLSLFTTFRHYEISIFVLTQKINKVCTILRENCDYAFIFMPNSQNSYKALYEDFGSAFFKSCDTFKKFIVANTSVPHQCIVYIASATNKEDKYKIFTAPKDLQNVSFVF